MTAEIEIREARIKQSGSLIATFFKLADKWGLNISQQKILLGDDALRRLEYQMQLGADLSLEDQTLARLVMLAGLEKKLNSSLSIDEARLFLRESLTRLGGKSPLDVILGDLDEGIVEVRRYLSGFETQRGEKLL